MNRYYRSNRFLFFLPLIIASFLVWITPMSATQRMVIVEEYTNSE